jgi:hypothetical protein
MTYPLSSPVSAGQPTASDHYNNLRLDSLHLGQAQADSVNVGTFFRRFFQGIVIDALATDRLRIPYMASNPPTIMINGYMLQAITNVDLPASMFSGGAATWYIFAVRSLASTTFTITVNTSASESTDYRLIGEVEWDGTHIGAITSYLNAPELPPADYDSGWFACTFNTTYTKAHLLGSIPRMVKLYHSTSPTGASEWVEVLVVQNGSVLSYSPVGVDATNIYVTTGADGGYNATIVSMRRASVAGYYRLFAWR